MSAMFFFRLNVDALTRFAEKIHGEVQERIFRGEKFRGNAINNDWIVHKLRQNCEQCLRRRYGI